MALNLYSSRCRKELTEDQAFEAEILSIALSNSFELTYVGRTNFLNNQVHMDTTTVDALSYLQMEKTTKKLHPSDRQQGRSRPPAEEHLKELASI